MMYCQVLFYDPVTDEPIEEFGWLPPGGAEDFCLRFNRIAESSKTEWRFAAIGKILETFPEPY